MNRKILIALIAIVVIIGAGLYAFSNTATGDSQVDIDAAALEDRGNLVVDSKSLDESNGFYHTDQADNNTILVKNGGALKLVNAIINKTGDTQTSGDDADFYGVNSAVLVNTNGTLDISNVEINTNSKGSNGIFVTNAKPQAVEIHHKAEPADSLQKPWAEVPAKVEMADSLLKCLQAKVVEKEGKAKVEETHPVQAMCQETPKPKSTM